MGLWLLFGRSLQRRGFRLSRTPPGPRRLRSLLLMTRPPSPSGGRKEKKRGPNYLLRPATHLRYTSVMRDSTKSKKYYTVTQAAERLGLDVSTVRRHVTAGSFPGTIRTSPGKGDYRIPEEAIEEFEAKRKI